MVAFKSALTERVDDAPTEDQIIVLEGVDWADFERILEIRGDRPVPRLTYLKGRLELMTPSRMHESVKGRIGRLVEVYCLRRGIEFETLGSWTLKDRRKKRGVEPDECYVFGVEPDRKRPHLAIEVVWTTGGLDKLDVYRKLDVQEVWFWRLGKLTLHALRGDRYEEVTASEVLPAIDLALLGSFIDRPTTSQAMREYGRRWTGWGEGCGEVRLCVQRAVLPFGAAFLTLRSANGNDTTTVPPGAGSTTDSRSRRVTHASTASLNEGLAHVAPTRPSSSTTKCATIRPSSVPPALRYTS